MGLGRRLSFVNYSFSPNFLVVGGRSLNLIKYHLNKCKDDFAPQINDPLTDKLTSDQKQQKTKVMSAKVNAKSNGHQNCTPGQT